MIEILQELELVDKKTGDEYTFLKIKSKGMFAHDIFTNITKLEINHKDFVEATKLIYGDE